MHPIQTSNHSRNDSIMMQCSSNAFVTVCAQENSLTSLGTWPLIVHCPGNLREMVRNLASDAQARATGQSETHLLIATQTVHCRLSSSCNCASLVCWWATCKSLTAQQLRQAHVNVLGKFRPRGQFGSCRVVVCQWGTVWASRRAELG